MENWVKIKGWDNYSISKYGYIRNESSNRILANVINHNGYLTVKLNSKNTKSKTFRINRLVAEHFCNNLENFPDVNHEDGIKLNNFYKNLKWCTKSYNMKHALKTGLVIREEGENATAAKLSKESIIEIFLLKGIRVSQDVATHYRVSRTLITLIQSGKHRLNEIISVLSVESVQELLKRKHKLPVRNKPIYEIDVDGRLLKEYLLEDLAKELGCSKPYVSELCRGVKGKRLGRRFTYDLRKKNE